MNLPPIINLGYMASPVTMPNLRLYPNWIPGEKKNNDFLFYAGCAMIMLWEINREYSGYVLTM